MSLLTGALLLLSGCARIKTFDEYPHPTPPCWKVPELPEVVLIDTTSGQHLAIIDDDIFNVLERDICKTTWILLYQSLPMYDSKPMLTPSYPPEDWLEPNVESLPVGLRPD